MARPSSRSAAAKRTRADEARALGAGEAVRKDEPLTLPSMMAETNGGGSPEAVPGFDIFRAVTAGFDTRRIAGPTLLAGRADGGFFSEGYATTASGTGSPASKPENVIGVDSRVFVPNTSMTPWRCICHLEVEYENGPVGYGTGFLIGPRTVVTAAHVLVDRTLYGWKKPRKAKRIRVVPGRNATLAPYGYFVSKFPEECIVPDVWLRANGSESEAAANDYAAIRTPKDFETENEPTGKRLGYFGLKSLPETNGADSATMLFVNNAGYPYEADKPYGTLWYNAGRIRDVGTTFIEYMVDTEGGQSGSPIYFFDERANQRYVVAIHTTGDFVNRGLRITPEIFSVLRQWAER